MADRLPGQPGFPMPTPAPATEPAASRATAAAPADAPPDPDSVPVAVEVFGVPRVLLGAARIEAAGATLGAVAADLAARCPALSGPVLEPATGWLRSGYTFVVDRRFTRDPDTPVGPAVEVLLVSSVAGGAR